MPSTGTSLVRYYNLESSSSQIPLFHYFMGSSHQEVPLSLLFSFIDRRFVQNKSYYHTTAPGNAGNHWFIETSIKKIYLIEAWHEVTQHEHSVKLFIPHRDWTRLLRFHWSFLISFSIILIYINCQNFCPFMPIRGNLLTDSLTHSHITN